MNAKELMIGDWLWYKGRFNAFPFKVEQINKRNVGYHADPCDSHMNYLRLSNCHPIPLNPEILNKNGIEWYFKCGHFKEDKDYKLELFEGNDSIFWTINLAEYDILNIKYVHQLQNALKLCGIEKEIIL